MKRFGLLALMAVLLLGLAIYFASCGGGGGGGGPVGGGVTLTSVATTTQGAKVAAALSASALTLTNTNISLSGIVGGMQAPNFKLPGNTANAMLLNKLTARFGPALKRARTLKASFASAAGYPVTYDCASEQTVTGGNTATPNSATRDVSEDGSTITITYNNCREGIEMSNGVTKIVGTPSSTTLTLGTSDSSSYSSTFYPDSISTTADSAMAGYFTIVFTESGTTSIIDSMVLSGWIENWDYTLDSHEKLVMNNFSTSDAFSAGTATADGTAYDVDTMTFNGSMTGTIYSSATATDVSYSETNSYQNFSFAYKTPSYPGASIYYYGNINGTFSISTTPAGRCIDGTFSVVTDTDIKFNSVSWTIAGGQITINGNTIVIFDANGGATVSINGGAAQPFTEADLTSLCPL